ncbi:MAG: SBBP repeat-containing protein [Crocinitomicaceae bacterium]|nr:SBBP repeat-containing protein [Crocinitomicaceae bacterium]
MVRVTIMMSFIFCNLFIYSQTVEWVESAGGSGNDMSHSIIVDNAGYIYSTGFFSDTVDFDPSAGQEILISNGNYDIFLQKLDQNGNLIWVKGMGGDFTDYGNSLAFDSQGNLYLAGSFQQTVDFDPNAGVHNLTSTSLKSAFVQKLDTAGNFIWVKHIDGIGQGSRAASIEIDGFDNIYTTGEFYGTLDFDPNGGTNFLTTANPSHSDAYIQKLDTSGNLIWAKSMIGPRPNYGFSIAVDQSGNVYSTGVFEDTIDLDPNPGVANFISEGNSDMYIQKLDSSGNLDWAKVVGHHYTVKGYAIDVDQNSNVLITGSFFDTVDFNPGVDVDLLYGDMMSIFALKLDSSGEYVWAKNMCSKNVYTNGHNIVSDNSGNVVVVGQFIDTVDFDPNGGVHELICDGGYDAFIQKLDENGNLLWAERYGGFGHDIIRGVAFGPSGNIFLAGTFQSQVDVQTVSGNNQIIANGWNDVFVMKIAGTSSIYEQEIETLKIYPNPTTGLFNVELPSGLEAGHLSIFNLQGQQISSISLQGEKNIELSIIDLPSGLYYLQVENDHYREIFRIIKQ